MRDYEVPHRVLTLLSERLPETTISTLHSRKDGSWHAHSPRCISTFFDMAGELGINTLGHTV